MKISKFNIFIFKLRNAIKRACLGMINLIFPKACPLCGEIIYKGQNLCEDCRYKINYIDGPTCLKCGKEVENEEVELCKDCKTTTRSYIKGFPAMKYMEPVDGSIAAFKYHNKRSYAKFFAGEIIRTCGKEILDINPDVIVPIPVHKSKMRKRGYNQAELLARELSGYLSVPVDIELIERKSNTLPQKTLNVEEREQNLKKAFISTDKIVKYKCALLVDDIYTSGATIEACTKALYEHGIKEVYYTSICIGSGD